MTYDPESMFRESWTTLARRVASGKRTKDEILYFMIDGSVRRFAIPLIVDDSTKEMFLTITLDIINAAPVEAIFFHVEAWFITADAPMSPSQLQEFLKKTPRPSQNPERRECVQFYFETADSTITTATAEILTDKKGKKEKRTLAALEPAQVGVPETRMSHLFKKARERSIAARNFVDDILRQN